MSVNYLECHHKSVASCRVKGKHSVAIHRVKNKYSIKCCRLGQVGEKLSNQMLKLGNKIPIRYLNLGCHYMGVGCSIT